MYHVIYICAVSAHRLLPNNPLQAIAHNCNKNNIVHMTIQVHQNLHMGKTRWEKPSYVRKATDSGSYGPFGPKNNFREDIISLLAWKYFLPFWELTIIYGAIWHEMIIYISPFERWKFSPRREMRNIYSPLMRDENFLRVGRYKIFDPFFLWTMPHRLSLQSAPDYGMPATPLHIRVCRNRHWEIGDILSRHSINSGECDFE